jgi:hypothetical protein
LRGIIRVPRFKLFSVCCHLFSPVGPVRGAVAWQLISEESRKSFR